MTLIQEDNWTPSSHSVTDWRLNIGRHALAWREDIRRDLALAGPPGLLSLFEALIESDRHLHRDDLLRTVWALCRPDTAEAAEELLDFFKGEDPRRHLWMEGEDGFYRPLGPHADFPN